MKLFLVRRFFASLAVASAFTFALMSALSLPTTRAGLKDTEIMSGSVFRAFGAGPPGLSLRPGKSKAAWVSAKHAPFDLIAEPADGSLELDFGEVTFGNGNMSPDVFRILNHSGEMRVFRAVVSPDMEDLFREVVIVGGGRISSGGEASVRMAVNGAARPPGSYSGTLVVHDAEDEFYRIVRITVRILGTHQAAAESEATELGAPVEGPLDGSVPSTEVPAAEPIQVPDQDRPEEAPAAATEPAPQAVEPAPESQPDSEPMSEPLNAPSPAPAPDQTSPSDVASPSVGWLG